MTETTEELRSSEAYDLAYDKLNDELPDCRHDGMCGSGWNSPSAEMLP